MDTVKEHVGGDKDGSAICEPDLGHVIADADGKKVTAGLLPGGEPCRYFIFIGHGFTPIHTVFKKPQRAPRQVGTSLRSAENTEIFRYRLTPIYSIYKILDSRWSLSRATMRDGNNNTLCLTKSGRIVKKIVEGKTW